MSGTALTATVVEEECCADPHSQGARQVITPSCRAVNELPEYKSPTS